MFILLFAHGLVPAGPGMAELQLQRSQLVSLVRWWVVQGPLGAGRATLIKWLVEAGSRQGPDPNPATVRIQQHSCKFELRGHFIAC